MPKKKILVAPLNWGLGHAARCIPIIYSLLENNFLPVLASNGEALRLLQHEFPTLKIYRLPSYKVRYSKRGYFLKLKLLSKSVQLQKAIRKEFALTQKIIDKENIQGIISDNRLGVHSKDVPSVYLTHQLQVLSGATTYFSTKLHQYYIKKFDECWVPDFAQEPNLSGKLSHLKKKFPIPIKYIGMLSRLQKQTESNKYAILVLLSGPEPQREYLEKRLFKLLKDYPKPVLFVKGVMEKKATKEQHKNLTIYNFLTGQDLAKAIAQSELIIARSGYSTIMDLAQTTKKAFFIPTPGQFEQQYLAARLKQQKIANFCQQDTFDLEKLETLENYKGFPDLEHNQDLGRFFGFL